MSTCQSCGGIIGRDCYNPSDCAYISEQMEAERQRQLHDDDSRIAALEARVREVESENAALRMVWLPCDQTAQCAVCGHIDWADDDGKHSDDCPVGFMSNKIRKLTDGLAAARVTIGELVEGLQPFAFVANQHINGPFIGGYRSIPDDMPLLRESNGRVEEVGASLGDCRRAAALIARVPQ